MQPPPHTPDPTDARPRAVVAITAVGLRDAVAAALGDHACVDVCEPSGREAARLDADLVVLDLAVDPAVAAGWLRACRGGGVPVIGVASPSDPVGSTSRGLRGGAHAVLSAERAAGAIVAAFHDAVSVPTRGEAAGLGMVGHSPAIRAVRAAIRRAGPVRDVPVLIQGESGTGKELVARAIHRATAPEEPFVAVNCAALTEALLEAELFGYEAGAFTGAAPEGRRGLFRAAGRGVLLLDEIGEMTPRLQAKLLRVLQERTVRAVGAEQDDAIECRIVASTNRTLADAVETGTFRRDLLYRLNAFTIDVAPLRDRPEDIVPLAWHFVRDAAARFDLTAPRLASDAIRALRAHRWPGNVRELRNVIDGALLRAVGPEVTVADLTIQNGEPRAVRPRLALHSYRLRDAEAQLIELVMEETGGNVSRAAERLGINRSTLYAKLRERRADA